MMWNATAAVGTKGLSETPRLLAPVAAHDRSRLVSTSTRFYSLPALCSLNPSFLYFREVQISDRYAMHKHKPSLKRQI